LALVTAFVVSDASSSSTHLTFSPPMVAGSSSSVFFCGMPSDAAGPVADTVMPTVMSACAGSASANAIAAPSAVVVRESFMQILLIEWRSMLLVLRRDSGGAAVPAATGARFWQSAPGGSIGLTRHRLRQGPRRGD